MNSEWGAIPRSLATDVSTMLNKKLGVSTGFKPSEWKDNMNLLGKLPVKTASGAIASFSDGADDVPIKSASFGIVASGGGGTPSTPVPIVGKSSVTVYHANKNLLVVGAQTDTINGVTFTVNSDGSVTVNGTASANTAFSICNVYLKAGSYILSGAPPTGISTTYEFQVLASNGTTYREYGSGRTFTLAEGTDGLNEVRILIRKNYVANNLVFYPQLELGSTVTTFEPRKNTPITVSLGQTVYGGTLAEDGTLTVTHKYDVFDGSNDESWARNVSSDKTRVYIPLSDAKASNGNFIGNYIIALSSAQGYPDEYKAWINASSQLVIGVPSTITSASDWKTFLSNNNLQVAYELATPIVITGLDEISMSTYLGDNSIWCDSGDSDVEYYADIQLALNQ